MRSLSLLKTLLVFPPTSRQISSFRKMSNERNRAWSSNRRWRRSSPSVQESVRSSGSVPDLDSLSPMDRHSSGSGARSNECFPAGGPPQRQISRGRVASGSVSKYTYHHSGGIRDSATGKKCYRQKNLPSPMEKSRMGPECSSLKCETQSDSSELSSMFKPDLSLEDSDADACGGRCDSPVGDTRQVEDLNDTATSDKTLQSPQYPHQIFNLSDADACIDNCGSPIGDTQQGEDLRHIATSDKTSQSPLYAHPIFDICSDQKNGVVRLAPSIFVKNRELRKEREVGQQIISLRPGMILMKKYMGHTDQVEIINKCRELGVGPGGFYRPGYSEGAKLRLWMMCLGKNWEPETRYNDDKRSIDDAVPPVIPENFSKLVGRAIQDAHAFIKQNSDARSVEAVLPNMKPNICIVNFYTDSGKLGLHQDRDESPESLRKGLPVVSFSFGDSADFLYGDDRNEDKAKKVTLESGDVLIFGGKSRHIYHGVPCIFPKTSPKLLADQSNLRPGRLNLTFREY